jgi:hypothetical protein
MPTIVDAFVLELGIDPAKFTTGQREALDSLKKFEEAALAGGKTVEAQGKKVEEFFVSLKRQAIGFLGIAFGASEVRNFIDNLSNMDAAVGRTARTLDMGTSELSAWQGAAEQAGGSAAAITGSMQGLTDQINRFMLTGEGSFLPAMNAIGISLFDANRNLKTSGQLFLEIADAVSKMDPARARAFLTMLGIDSSTINLLIQGRSAVEAYLESARKAGVTTDQSAKQSAEYNRQLTLLERSATDAGRSMLTVFAPALIAVSNAFKDFFDFMRGQERKGSWSQFFLELFETFGKGDVPGKPTSSRSPMDDAKAKLAKQLNQQSVGGGSTGNLSTNWQNFLSGLSYLETSQTGAPSTTSSAQGFFQFLSGTAAKATGAGIADPRSGSWAQQAAATMDYIKKFYPGAATAIDQGNFGEAAMILKGEWPSLPGGSQPQSGARYKTWLDELRGGGPRPPVGAPAAAAAKTSMTTTRGGDTNTSATNIGQVNITVPGGDSSDIERNMSAALKRSSFASQANFANV